MKLAALVFLVAVGIAFNDLGSEALTPHQVIQALMGGAPPYWKVMFALDSSGSISNSEWTCSKSSTINILTIIDNTPGPNSIAPLKHRIGLVRFSTWAQLIFALGTHPFYPQNAAAIAAVPKGSGGLTNVNHALALCSIQLGASGKRLVWIMTDGGYNYGGDPRPRANVMKRKGIIICVVAVGDNVNWTVINDIASWVYIPSLRRWVKCVMRYHTCAAYYRASLIYYPTLPRVNQTTVIPVTKAAP
ncbi:uncharacterized protein LOC106155928 [Lingula anatina]|uniref:Uncharacterized protein LOC106155928 n=1 Tax=Lingula anatina TaxID=7574 RepID=A0A1S3HN06_LINAN|nr:uncharacterized protein LOC106155928 [Lingula anatina]|eukprot:XP_013386424.1 uncharacterized protein LOC106155928 [Lingula anatina]